MDPGESQPFIPPYGTYGSWPHPNPGPYTSAGADNTEDAVISGDNVWNQIIPMQDLTIGPSTQMSFVQDMPALRNGMSLALPEPVAESVMPFVPNPSNMPFNSMMPSFSYPSAGLTENMDYVMAMAQAPSTLTVQMEIDSMGSAGNQGVQSMGLLPPVAGQAAMQGQMQYPSVVSAPQGTVQGLLPYIDTTPTGYVPQLQGFDSTGRPLQMMGLMDTIQAYPQQSAWVTVSPAPAARPEMPPMQAFPAVSPGTAAHEMPVESRDPPAKKQPPKPVVQTPPPARTRPVTRSQTAQRPAPRPPTKQKQLPAAKPPAPKPPAAKPPTAKPPAAQPPARASSMRHSTRIPVSPQTRWRIVRTNPTTVPPKPSSLRQVTYASGSTAVVPQPTVPQADIPQLPRLWKRPAMQPLRTAVLKPKRPPQKFVLTPERLALIGLHPRLPEVPSEVLRPVVDFILKPVQVVGPEDKGKGKAGKQGSALVLSRQVPWLLMLPPTFWSRMHLYLDYKAFLKLAEVSPHFNAVRLERFVPWKRRFAFLLEKEYRASINMHKFDSNLARMTLGCFLCFRIRPLSKFPSTFAICSAVVHARQPYTGDRIFRNSKYSGQDVEQEDDADDEEEYDDEMPFFPPPFASLNPSPRHQPLYAGKIAIRRPGSLWADHGPGAHPDSTENIRRYCLDCAIQTRLLKPGSEVTVREKRYWVCYCHEFHPVFESENDCSGCGFVHE